MSLLLAHHSPSSHRRVVHSLSNTRLTVGRSPQCTLSFPSDPLVSGSHCHINNGFLIDHQSTNGTLLNGKKIPYAKKVLLKRGDVLMIGNTKLTVEEENEQNEQQIQDNHTHTEEETKQQLNVNKTPSKPNSSSLSTASTALSTHTAHLQQIERLLEEERRMADGSEDSSSDSGSDEETDDHVHASPSLQPSNLLHTLQDSAFGFKLPVHSPNDVNEDDDADVSPHERTVRQLKRNIAAAERAYTQLNYSLHKADKLNDKLAAEFKERLMKCDEVEQGWKFQLFVGEIVKEKQLEQLKKQRDELLMKHELSLQQQDAIQQKLLFQVKDKELKTIQQQTEKCRQRIVSVEQSIERVKRSIEDTLKTIEDTERQEWETRQAINQMTVIGAVNVESSISNSHHDNQHSATSSSSSETLLFTMKQQHNTLHNLLTQLLNHSQSRSQNTDSQLQYQYSTHHDEDDQRSQVIALSHSISSIVRNTINSLERLTQHLENDDNTTHKHSTADSSSTHNNTPPATISYSDSSLLHQLSLTQRRMSQCLWLCAAMCTTALAVAFGKAFRNNVFHSALT